MKAAVYDCDNIAKIVELPDIDQIEWISVAVITGDEVVTFQLKNDAPIYVDSCRGRRLVNYMDYNYVIEGEDEIRRWLNYVPSLTCLCVSYDRYYEFCE